MKKPVKITRVRFAEPACVGNNSEMVSHISKDTYIDAKPVSIYFDDDNRFLRLEGASFVELLPLANVTSIRVEPA
jgi:hypothetical protein